MIFNIVLFSLITNNGLCSHTLCFSWLFQFHNQDVHHRFASPCCAGRSMEGLERALKRRQSPVRSESTGISSGHMKRADVLAKQAQSPWAKPLSRVIGRQSEASIQLYKMHCGRASVDSRTLYDEDYVDNKDVTSSFFHPELLRQGDLNYAKSSRR